MRNDARGPFDWFSAFAGHRSANPWPFAGFAFGNQSRFFQNGELRLAILSLLNEGPKHGYQLMKELEERSGGIYRASAGSIYPTLQQLEDEDMIRAEQQGGKRIYHITRAGRKELDSDTETVRRIWERAEECEDWRQHFGPDTMAVLPSIAPLVKASLRAAGRGGFQRVREILERTTRELEKL